jgi:hypothetical protein
MGQFFNYDFEQLRPSSRGGPHITLSPSPFVSEISPMITNSIQQKTTSQSQNYEDSTSGIGVIILILIFLLVNYVLIKILFKSREKDTGLLMKVLLYFFRLIFILFYGLIGFMVLIYSFSSEIDVFFRLGCLLLSFFIFLGAIKLLKYIPVFDILFKLDHINNDKSNVKILNFFTKMPINFYKKFKNLVIAIKQSNINTKLLLIIIAILTIFEIIPKLNNLRNQIIYSSYYCDELPIYKKIKCVKQYINTDEMYKRYFKYVDYEK